MKHIYMSLSITVYSNHRIAPYCRFYERIDNGEMTCKVISIEEAKKLQWELVKAGAKRTFCPNMFNNAIANVDVDYWMYH